MARLSDLERRFRRILEDSQRRPWVYTGSRALEIYRSIVAMDMGAPTWNQDSHRFYEDDAAADSLLTPLAAVDTGVNIGDGETVGLDASFCWRVEVGNDGDATGLLNPKLQYNHVFAGWNDVNGSSSVIRSTLSTLLGDNDATSNVLTAGAGTFDGGKMDEADGTFSTGNNIAAGNHGEWLWIIEVRSADVSNNDPISLRAVEGDGTVFASWAVGNITAKVGAPPTAVKDVVGGLGIIPYPR